MSGASRPEIFMPARFRTNTVAAHQLPQAKGRLQVGDKQMIRGGGGEGGNV
jgi:hypothetical protein